MELPKSNPDLNWMGGRRPSKRDSKGFRNSRNSKIEQFKIRNPLLNLDEMNMFLLSFQSEMYDMEYISKSSIQNIEIRPRRRQSSVLQKNLQKMHELATKQMDRSRLLSKEGGSIECIPNDGIKHNLAYTMVGENDDKLSIELNGYYDYNQRVLNDFNIFQPDDYDYLEYERIQSYSAREIESDKMMEEEWRND